MTFHPDFITKDHLLKIGMSLSSDLKTELPTALDCLAVSMGYSNFQQLDKAVQIKDQTSWLSKSTHRQNVYHLWFQFLSLGVPYYEALEKVKEGLILSGHGSNMESALNVLLHQLETEHISTAFTKIIGPYSQSEATRFFLVASASDAFEAFKEILRNNQFKENHLKEKEDWMKAIQEADEDKSPAVAHSTVLKNAKEMWKRDLSQT